MAKACKKRRWRWLLIIICMLSLPFALFCCAPSIGHNPAGADLERLRKSPNYAEGKFNNQIPTPMFAEGTSFFSALFGGLFAKKQRLKPEEALAASKTDFKNMPDNSLV